MNIYIDLVIEKSQKLTPT